MMSTVFHYVGPMLVRGFGRSITLTLNDLSPKSRHTLNVVCLAGQCGKQTMNIALFG